MGTGRGLNIPFVLSVDAAALMVKKALLYKVPILEDSFCQSAFESCRMQSESIHRYSIPSSRVMSTASRNVCGMLATGMPSTRSARVAVVVFNDLMVPQQWLSAT